MALSARSGLRVQRTSRQSATSRPAVLQPVVPVRHAFTTSPARQTAVVVRAEGRGSGDSGFLAGFLFGGVIMGTLGFVFAPQISKALLGDDQRLKLPRFMEDEQPKDPEQTKQDLIEKIAQLNASIDEVASQLKGKEEITSKIDSDGIRIA